MQPSSALAAPDSPLRAPCGTTGTRCSVATRITCWTSRRRAGVHERDRLARGAVHRAVHAVRGEHVSVDHDCFVGQPRPQRFEHDRRFGVAHPPTLRLIRSGGVGPLRGLDCPDCPDFPSPHCPSPATPGGSMSGRPHPAPHRHDRHRRSSARDSRSRVVDRPRSTRARTPTCGASPSSTGTSSCGSSWPPVSRTPPSASSGAPGAVTTDERQPDRDRRRVDRTDQTLLAGDVDGVALSVVIFFFVVVTAGGFYAARWRKARRHGSRSTSGDSVAGASARSSPGSCSVATSTRRTRSSRCRRRCTPPERSAASSRCPTRSWSIR